MKVIYLFIIFLIISLCMSEKSYAQPAETAAFEGYVFNKNTGKPVTKALIEFNIGDGPDSGTETDTNGFYQFDWIGARNDRLSHYLAAYCETKKETYVSTIVAYTELRPQVYVRNIYIDMPIKFHSCVGGHVNSLQTSSRMQ